jgi:hypothetical protein
MKNGLIALALTLLLSMDASFATDISTQSRLVESVQHGSDGTLYVYNSAGWGAPGCEAAAYAYIQSTEAAFDKLFAMILTAKLAQTAVSVRGTCTNSNYFYFTHVNMS